VFYDKRICYFAVKVMIDALNFSCSIAYHIVVVLHAVLLYY